jgi:hypothetical protein
MGKPSFSTAHSLQFVLNIPRPNFQDRELPSWYQKNQKLLHKRRPWTDLIKSALPKQFPKINFNIIHPCKRRRSRDSSVGKATRIRAGWPRNRGATRGSDISLLHNAHNAGAHPASYPMVHVAVSPEVKRQGREADHLTSIYCWV